jgi:hypothetical protein
MWSLVTHQLENARMLATLDKRRPRQASLRRAVSTAYYALFQALCETCASRLVGRGKPWEVFTPMFRALDHRAASDVLRPSSFANVRNLQRLASAFTELRAAREWADYNPEPRPNFDEARNATFFTREEALALVDSASEAAQILDDLDDQTRLRLATRLVTKSRK